MTVDEYFFDQVFTTVKGNVENHTLPFFDVNSHQLPIELSTGKIINDTNLIALEQAAAFYGYKSNYWIYGSEIEKLHHDGIELKVKKDAEPVLCKTHYRNYERIAKDELLIAEGGAKTQNQFLYNLDSFTEKSQKALQKRFSNVQQINDAYTFENFKHFKNNISKSKKEYAPKLAELQESIKKRISKIPTQFGPVISAHAKHFCSEAIGNNAKTPLPQTELACYSLLQNWINNTLEKNQPTWVAGEELCKALDAGTWYGKSYISEKFNHENGKIQEENIQKNNNIKRLNKGVER